MDLNVFVSINQDKSYHKNFYVMFQFDTFLKKLNDYKKILPCWQYFFITDICVRLIYDINYKSSITLINI